MTEEPKPTMRRVRTLFAALALAMLVLALLALSAVVLIRFLDGASAS